MERERAISIHRATCSGKSNPRARLGPTLQRSIWSTKTGEQLGLA